MKLVLKTGTRKHTFHLKDNVNEQEVLTALGRTIRKNDWHAYTSEPTTKTRIFQT